MNTFESLFVNYQPRLVTYADSIVQDHSIALDMVQDTFFTFWKKYSGQDEKSSARLLFAMTRNRCINYLKRERLLNYVDLSFLDGIQKTEKLFGLDFYRNNMGACLNDKVKLHLTVVLAEIIYRKLAQGLELAANEVLGKVSLASIVLIGQEKHGRGRMAHRTQQATIEKIELEGADVFINL